MNLEIDELMNEAEQDTSFDNHNPTSSLEKTANLAKLREKWARYRHIARMTMRQAEIVLDEIYSKRYDYYLNDSPRQYHRGDISTIIKKDKEYMSALAKAELARGKFEYIEQVIKSIDQLQWNLSNYTKMYIFLNGG